MGLDIEETNYNDLKRRIYGRHTQGIDIATLVLKNNNFQRIA